MELEITPEPTPEERAAIEVILAELLAERPSGRDAWWEAGVADASDDEVFRTSPGP